MIARILKYLVIVTVLIGVGLPFFLSVMMGGWTTKYTSPNAFALSEMPDLTGKVALVTGGNVGIGFESAKELARKGAHVFLTSRSMKKGEIAIEKIKQEISTDNSAPKIELLQLDLSSLQSIRQCAEIFLALDLSLDILLLNAGVMKSPGEAFVGKAMDYGYEMTKDGFESHIGINHIGHFYLTELLTDKLKASAPARVVVVASLAEQGGYSEGIRPDTWYEKTVDYEDGRAYAQSKLANVLFAQELAERLQGTGVSAYSLHPGVIATELSRYMMANAEEEAQKEGPVVKALNSVANQMFNAACMSTPVGALTQLYLATTNDELKNGGFYHPIGRLLPHAQHPKGNDRDLQKTLWESTVKALRTALEN